MCAPLSICSLAPVGASPVLAARAPRRASMVRRRHVVAAGENERDSGRDRDERRKQHQRLVHARTSLMSRQAGGKTAPWPVGWIDQVRRSPLEGARSSPRRDQGRAAIPNESQIFAATSVDG
jgi:hypothetical protein